MLFDRVQWLGQRLLEGVERVGEAIVSVLGLDDSRYQDILDNMTPREQQEAERVHLQREEEYRLFQENHSVEVMLETGQVTPESEDHLRQGAIAQPPPMPHPPEPTPPKPPMALPPEPALSLSAPIEMNAVEITVKSTKDQPGCDVVDVDNVVKKNDCEEEPICSPPADSV
eukprot:gene5192-5719_t